MMKIEIIDTLASILHKKWEYHPDKETFIIGFWAEDNTTYDIIVPYQLRNKIIIMQNWLSDKYQSFLEFKNKSSEIQKWFNK